MGPKSAVIEGKCVVALEVVVNIHESREIGGFSAGGADDSVETHGLMEVVESDDDLLALNNDRKLRLFERSDDMLPGVNQARGGNRDFSKSICYALQHGGVVGMEFKVFE
ncbi:hypothetical protein D3C87_1814320 [compost metagenome]